MTLISLLTLGCVPQRAGNTSTGTPTLSQINNGVTVRIDKVQHQGKDAHIDLTIVNDTPDQVLIYYYAARAEQGGRSFDSVMPNTEAEGPAGGYFEGRTTKGAEIRFTGLDANQPFRLILTGTQSNHIWDNSQGNDAPLDETIYFVYDVPAGSYGEK